MRFVDGLTRRRVPDKARVELEGGGRSTRMVWSPSGVLIVSGLGGALGSYERPPVGAEPGGAPAAERLSFRVTPSGRYLPRLVAVEVPLGGGAAVFDVELHPARGYDAPRSWPWLRARLTLGGEPAPHGLVICEHPDPRSNDFSAPGPLVRRTAMADGDGFVRLPLPGVPEELQGGDALPVTLRLCHRAEVGGGGWADPSTYFDGAGEPRADGLRSFSVALRVAGEDGGGPEVAITGPAESATARAVAGEALTFSDGAGRSGPAFELRMV